MAPEEDIIREAYAGDHEDDADTDLGEFPEPDDVSKLQPDVDTGGGGGKP